MKIFILKDRVTTVEIYAKKKKKHCKKNYTGISGKYNLFIAIYFYPPPLYKILNLTSENYGT